VDGSLAVEVVHYMLFQQVWLVVMEVAVLAVEKMVVELLLLVVLQILVVAEVVQNVLLLVHQGQVVQA
jgi:hypothetical protein